MSQLERYKVRLEGGYRITGFGDAGIETEHGDGHAKVFEADNYVLALVVPDNQFAN